MSEDSSKAILKLAEQLERRNKLMEMELSPVNSFIISIIRGVGYALGATLIAGILLAVLGGIASGLNLGDIPILQQVVDRVSD